MNVVDVDDFFEKHFDSEDDVDDEILRWMYQKYPDLHDEILDSRDRYQDKWGDNIDE